MITPDSIEAKYQRIQALIERMDAQPKCRDKPLKNRAGRVVKPATVQCGTVCRQKQNCTVTKGELREVRSAFEGRPKQEIAAAIKALIEAKKTGRLSAIAHGPKGEDKDQKPVSAREKRAKDPSAQAEPRSKPKDPTVQLGKPTHDRITSPEEAIASGRAILGDLIGKMAAEYSSEDPHNYKQMVDEKWAEYAAAKEAGYKVESDLAELTSRQRQGEGSAALKREITKKQKELVAVTKKTKKAGGEFQVIASDDGLIKYGNIKNIRYRLSQYGSNPSPEEKETIKRLEASLLKKEKAQRERSRRPISRQVIQSLIDNSALSKEDAIAAVNAITIKGDPGPDVKERIVDFVRMTNGQCLETLKTISAIEGRGYADMSKGSLFYERYNTKMLFHEMGHHVEYAAHNAREFVGNRFVLDRSTGPAEKMSVLAPFSGYRSDEIAQPDHFIDPYVGKIYPGFPGLSEVVAMGLQALSSPKLLAELALKDPDHLALVIGIASQRAPAIGKKEPKTDSAPVAYFGLNPHPFRKPLWK